ncbi:hypothetical protein EG327_000411 [Venturia inaequalis]|uniref:RAVE subunit 2/Rogdi n=1 Tax=Venturia inaequalis TaxID=5025 RepID=A0A8H3VQL3_VENIN|nr:hypothetical protein EG327_000411 [Venturia inaequalis]
MATAIWPSIPAQQLADKETRSLANELEWLLTALQDTLKDLKAGLEEVSSLLAPTEQGSTLVVSSHRSESLKGFITRVGTRIVKGNIQLRLATLPPSKGHASYPLVTSSAPQAPTLVLEQLTAARTLINACLDVVDASTWAGDSKDPQFIAGQMRLLDVNISEAKAALKGAPEKQIPWWQHPVEAETFEPPLPTNLAFHLCIVEASLLLEIRTLEPLHPAQSDFSAFSFGNRLASALGASRVPGHDEADKVFTYKDQEVKVKEKVRVESQDPNLMAAMAKLNALERSVALGRKALDIVMGQDEDDQ